MTRGVLAAVVAAAALSAQAPAGPDGPPARVSGALSALSRIRRDAVLHSLAGHAWRVGTDGLPNAVLWVAGEFDAAAATRDGRWEAGLDVSIEAVGPGNSPLDAARLALTRDDRSFVVRLPAGGSAAPGDYDIRLTSRTPGGTVGATETLHVTVPRASGGSGEVLLGQPVLFRHGPFSGPAWMPAGDLRFRREERARTETAVAGPDGAVTVRLLDRNGNPLHLPVASSERREGGARIVSAEVVLAPLTAGDYLIETSVAGGAAAPSACAAFRLVR